MPTMHDLDFTWFWYFEGRLSYNRKGFLRSMSSKTLRRAIRELALSEKERDEIEIELNCRELLRPASKPFYTKQLLRPSQEDSTICRISEFLRGSQK